MMTNHFLTMFVLLQILKTNVQLFEKVTPVDSTSPLRTIRLSEKDGIPTLKVLSRYEVTM